MDHFIFKSQRVAALEGVSELMQIVSDSQLQRKVYVPSLETNSHQSPFPETVRKPFIVVEGLDATGTNK